MILALAASVAIASEIAAFFPTAAGTSWTFETEAEGTKVTSKMTAGSPITVGDAEAVPFVTKVLSQTVETIFYRVTEDSVLVVAYDPKAPFASPRPVLKYAEKGAVWTIETEEQGMPLKMSCTTAKRRSRKVLDQTVETLELKVDAVLGAGDLTMEMKQTAVYGRGVGLVEIQEERKVGKTKHKRSIRLVQYEPPAPLGGA